MQDRNAEWIVSEARRLKGVGKFVEAKLLRTELERIHDQSAADATVRVSNLNMLAFLATCSGDLAEAVRAAEKCLSIYREMPHRRDEKLATYLMMLACVLAEAGRFVDAVAHGEEAFSLFRRCYGEKDEFTQFRARDVECMRRGEVRHYIERP